MLDHNVEELAITEHRASIVLDTESGQRGDIAQWVEQFSYVWDAPRQRLDRLMRLLSTDIVLKAPTIPPVSRGQIEGRAAFERALRAMPDLRADIHRWSTSGELLFIEMTFSATVGNRKIAWDDVDRILFRNGEAVERVAYFNPEPIKRAFLRSPSALWQRLRLRLGF